MRCLSVILLLTALYLAMAAKAESDFCKQQRDKCELNCQRAIAISRCDEHNGARSVAYSCGEGSAAVASSSGPLRTGQSGESVSVSIRLTKCR